MKKLIVGYSPFGFNPSYKDFLTNVKDWIDVREKGFENIDLFVLWGGTDINPDLYGQTSHYMTEKPDSIRDSFEKKAIRFCTFHKIPILGICRGAQMLCVMAGGKLIQHVDGHYYGHGIETKYDTRLLVNSSHHQMMYPYDVPHELIAWCNNTRSMKYEGEKAGININEMLDKKEAEVVYFPSLKGLAIQAHPEWATATEEFKQFTNELVDEYLLHKEKETC